MSGRGLLLLCAAASLAASGACGQERIEVRTADSADYQHAALLGAVDKFVAAGRTAPAYAELSQTVFELRGGMDRSVAEQAELKLMVLALAPVQAVQAQPMAAQVDALALTVWPTLLAPVVESDDLLERRDPKTSPVMPRPGEDARSYVIRLCGGPLASDCKQVVPEQQGQIVASLALRRGTERVRNAVADCVMCGAEPGWREAVRTWEALDRMAASQVNDVARRADPDNWPAAGNAAGDDLQLPEAEINEAGEVVIAGQRYGLGQRIGALRDLRGDSAALALHLRPETPLAQVRALLGDVRRSGAARVAVIARLPRYPWDRKIYWIADGVGTSAGLRPTDSLQLLLHAVDAVAGPGPGTIARVD